jgi:ubiquinone/menaquinone biosynthesis C-methylase UbiE
MAGRMDRWAVWVGRALAWWLLWQLAVRAWRKLWPRPRPAWLGWGLTSRLRDLAWPADHLVERLAIRPGMRVIEAGAGVGALTPALARSIGPTGQLIAVDDRLDIVEALQIAALEQGNTRVVVQQAPPTTLPAEPATSDLVVLTSVFGGAPDKTALAAEAYRVLRPGGAVAITELLTDPDYCLASTVVTHLVLAGFGIEREAGNFASYTVMGRKPGPAT